MDLSTTYELRRAITICNVVVVQARFGCSEKWVRISKVEARELARGLPGTPHDCEMATGRFGELNQDLVLYMGG